jgi:uncharacterized protein YbbK (DUF523 family)
MKMLPKILVSSCLIGKKCAYDGEARTSTAVKECCETYGYIPICPEMEGGLGCPRERHEIVGGSGSDVLDGRARVISISGKDMTDNFFSGAERTLKTAKANAIKVAVLKSRSPSCGKNIIHTGNFDGEAREGCGVTTALLVRNGIKVFTEKEIDEIKRELTP